MQCRHSALVAFAAATLLQSTSPAYAQSWLEILFGGGQKPAPRAPSVPRTPEVRQSAQNVEQTQRDNRIQEDGDSDGTQTRRRSSEMSGQQTMCVRTCDGYYWPIRYPSNRKDFESDEALCKASCGTEAKLYSRATPGTPPEEMKDENGRSYGDTPTAFLYRKRLVDGCACKPMPWSYSETARHERYALIEEEKRIRLAEAERTEREAQQAAAIAAAMTPQQQAAAAAEAARLEAAVAEANAEAGLGPGGVPLADDGKPVKTTLAAIETTNAPRKTKPQRMKSETRQPSVASARPAKTPPPTRIAAAPKPGMLMLGGPPKFRYPGD